MSREPGIASGLAAVGGRSHPWEDTPPFVPEMLDGVRAAAGDGPVLVALDIDGTILGHDGGLSPRVHDGVASVRAAGAEVVLATGRSVTAVLPVLRWLGVDRAWAVCSNGAVTVHVAPEHPGGFEVVDLVTFDAGPALRALLAAEPDVLVAVEDVGIGFKVSAPFPAGELLAPTEVATLEELVAEPVARVTLRAPGRSAHHFASLVERVGLHGVSYAVGWTAWLDLTPEGISKASALELVRERVGADAGATLALGDGQNDREMLQWAGLGVAMGNADAETIGCADAVTGHVDADGLATVLLAL